MYYTFGKTEHYAKVDKDNRLSLDIGLFIANGAIYCNGEFRFKDEYIYLILNNPTNVDGVEIINNQYSAFYKKSEMLNFATDICFHEGKLKQNSMIYDFTKYFNPTYDNNDNIPTFVSNQLFFDSKFSPDSQFGNLIPTGLNEKLNSIQYIVSTPITRVQISSDIFDNHSFLLSSQYQLDFLTSFKLYCIPNDI